MSAEERKVAIILRGVPEEVRRSLKAAAARCGESMTHYIITAARLRAAGTRPVEAK